MPQTGYNLSVDTGEDVYDADLAYEMLSRAPRGAGGNYDTGDANTPGGGIPWWKKILMPWASGAAKTAAVTTGVNMGTGLATRALTRGDGNNQSQADIGSILSQVSGSQQGNAATGDLLQGQSQEALAQVLKYFKNIIGGDPGAALEATRPERARVIDQYDGARKMISEFGPRGGGSNAAMAESRFDQASDLSNITATARSKAINDASSLGVTLASLGINADQLASADLNTIINALLAQKGYQVQERGQNQQMAAGMSEGAGTLLGLYLTRDGGAWGKKS